MKQILILIVALMCVCSVQAKKDRTTRIYLFGVATNLNDSTVYITELQTVDSAFVTKKAVLPERSIYSYQLQNHLEEHEGMKHMTVAVMWSTSRKRVEKDFIKIRRRYTNDPHSTIQPIRKEDFVFTTVEHFE